MVVHFQPVHLRPDSRKLDVSGTGLLRLSFEHSHYSLKLKTGWLSLSVLDDFLPMCPLLYIECPLCH